MNPPPRPAIRSIQWGAIALIILAAGAAYRNSFSGPFVLDDLPSIAGNPTIRHLWPLRLPLSPPHGDGLTVEGRPMVNLSLAVNYAISGTRVGSYHALNLLIHVLAGLTLFGVIRQTVARGRAAAFPDSDEGTAFAFAAALLWTLHPLQTESVAYVVQRAESLMGLFYLLTLYGFIRGSATGDAPRFWLGLSWLACLCGMASKEVMVSAPLAVLLYDRTFVAGSFRAAWRRRRGYYLALGSTWILLAGLVAGAGTRGGTSGLGSGVAAGTYWLTQFPAVIRYLRLSFWPSPLIFDYGTEWVKSVPAILPDALAVLALAAATLFALRRQPALGFLGFCFFALLAPTSLIPGNRQTAAEHRMYLPLAAVVVLGTAGIHRLFGRRRAGRAFLIAGLALALGFLTFRRNRDYSSALTLYRDTAAKLPGNAFAQCNLGVALSALGRVPEAIGHYEEALRLWPDYPIAHDDLGSALLRVGRLDEAVFHFREALRLSPKFADADDNLGTALIRQGRPEEAIACYREALRLDPAHADARNNLANALARQGELPEAIDQYRRALELRPDDADTYYDLGNALLHSGQPDRAAAAFDGALRLKPDYAAAHENLGNALLRQGRAGEAVAHYEAALRLDPDDAAAHYNLGNGLASLGRIPEAAAQFQWALRLQPDFPAARAALAKIAHL